MKKSWNVKFRSNCIGLLELYDLFCLLSLVSTMVLYRLVDPQFA